MPQPQPVPLEAFPIQFGSADFRTIWDWPFADPFVRRILQNDIPQRVWLNRCQMLGYREPGGPIAGFGTIEVCTEHWEHTGNRAHAYIPLLAINPTIQSRGYGTSILKHLIGQAAIFALQTPGRDARLFLDVYTTSTRAIALYRKFGFVELTAEPIEDPDEPGKSYLVMAKRVTTE